MTELDALLILNSISGLRNIRKRRLIDHLGSAAKFFRLNAAELSELKATNILPCKVLTNIQNFPKDIYLKKEYNLVRSHDICLLSFQDTDYPKRLSEIPDAPLILYIKGDPKKLAGPAIAMVGSRRASFYGVMIAEKFAAGLAESGLTIVSGMARGIDTASHRGALKAKGTTVAVLGCGLCQVYPQENEKLAAVISNSGAVVSEFPMEAQALPYHFPQRNRIISGLSLGVVVVEASQKSGALITSDFALEQGREVFAIPGKVDQPNSQGVNRLIKEGAKLVSCVEDILEELEEPLRHYLKEDLPGVREERKSDARTRDLFHGLTPEEESICRKLSDLPCHIDDLAQQLNFSVAPLMALLLKLELKGRVKRLPGQLFVRKDLSR